jgi:putative transcriptional regulator
MGIDRLACVMLGLAVVGASSHRDPSQLRPGLFLYASPAQEDPNFAESVVLLIEHGPAGSLGVVVNRPTSVPLRELLGGVTGREAGAMRFRWGGPVEPRTILALVRGSWASGSARPVLPDVHLTTDLGEVRAVLAGREPGERLRGFSGYAGWGAGQLATEVRAGAWVIDRADAASIFQSDTSSLWQRVHRILQRLEARATFGA